MYMKKTKIPEKVYKLLRSTTLEDVVLGVDWCHNHLGEEWCIDNFHTDNSVLYTTNCYKGSKRLCVVVQYNNTDILIGGSYIQALKPDYVDPDHIEFINYKTK